ncbi:hypothetical protein LCGC14_2140490, partial [marine sediment metagenome]
MAGKKASIELLGFETRTGTYYPLAEEVKRIVAGVEKLVTIPIPPCDQISFIKKLRSDGVTGKLKPRFRRLRA